MSTATSRIPSRPGPTTPAALDEVALAARLDAGETVLLDFHADWCPPCRMLAPELDALAGRLGGRVVVGTVDVDAAADLAARFGIRSIPTLVLLNASGELARRSGFAPAAELERFVLDHTG